MKGLLNFFKRHSKFILILILLTSFQVFCDFTIPNYTYKMIDTGIINEGVNESVPTVIRRSSMQKLTNFMTKEDKNKVLNSYSFINKKYERYMKKYPILKDEAIYLLNGEQDPNLESILENAILLTINEEYSEISEIVPKIIIGEEETLEDAFKRLTKEEKENFIKQFNENKKELIELTIDNSINKYIKIEYKEVGVNVSNIKSKYLILTSIKMGLLFIVRTIITIYIAKRISTTSLNTTKILSKEILDKTSKLTYEEIEKRDVKSLITKNPKDISNLPKLIFSSISLIFYIIIFCLLSFITLRNTLPSLLVLKLIGIELLVMIFIILIGYILLKKLRRKKFKKNSLMIINSILSIGILVSLLLVIIAGIVLSCLKFNYFSSIHLTLGELMMVIGYTLEFSVVIIFLLIFIIMSFQIIKTSIKIDKLIKSKEYINEPEKPKKFRKNAKHFVEFKNVSYKNSKEKDTNLSNINFKINANSIFGVLCSTKEEGNLITKLLLKLECLKSGNIIIDGIDINDVEIRDLRTKIYCFYPKNVWYYEEDLESTKFLKSPDIYILNDFNNDLDLESNEALNYFITRKAKNKIIIIISTDIDNLTNADKVAVIDKGKLVGLGKHKELIKTCKEYQKIIEK